MKNEELQKLEKYLLDNLMIDAEHFCLCGQYLNSVNIAAMNICIPSATLSKKRTLKEEKLNEWLKIQINENESFQQKLNRFLAKKGFGNNHSKFYSKIDLDRRVFSRISSEATEKQPKKETVFKIIIGLELLSLEAEELLKSAGYYFNSRKKADLIVKYCVENRIYSPQTIDEFLYAFEEPPLFSVE